MTTSSSWPQLPYEIQKKIFVYLHDRDLIQLQKSCRSWRMTAIEVYYHHLSVFLDCEQERQCQLIEALKHPDNPARHFVKRLRVDEQWLYERSSRDFTVLAALGSLCPNLITIESNKPTREFYKELRDLRQAGHLLKVEHISAPNHSHTDNYYKTMMAFKDTLVELLVNRDLNIDLPQIGSIKDAFKIAAHLGDFKCLTRLHIDLAQDVALHKVEELLALCYNASMLDTIKVTMAIKKEDEETFDDDDMNVQGLPRLPRVNKFTLIDREHLSNQDMVYIMHKFPGLKHLHSSTEDHHSDDPEADRHTAEIVHQFSRYISKLDRCHISLFKATPALVLDAITQLSKGFKVDDFLVYGSDEVDDEKYAYLNIQEPSRAQRIFHTVYVILPTLRMNPLYQTALRAFAPEIKKLRLYGTMNHRGALAHTTSFSDVQITTNRLLSDSLEFVLSNFPRLKKLNLINLIISTTRSSASISSEKIQLDDLSIYQCALNPHTLHQFSHYLDYVERFRIEDVACWIRDDLAIMDSQKNYEIDMPYTAFGTIRLPVDHQADSIIIKICTDTTTKYFLHHHNDFDARHQLTERAYGEIKALENEAQNIHVKCRHFTKIDVGCCKLSTSD